MHRIIGEGGGIIAHDGETGVLAQVPPSYLKQC
jgi:hypothetical protein